MRSQYAERSGGTVTHKLSEIQGELIGLSLSDGEKF